MLYMTDLNLMHLSSAKPIKWGKVRTPDTETKPTNQGSELCIHFGTDFEEIMTYNLHNLNLISGE